MFLAEEEVKMPEVNKQSCSAILMKYAKIYGRHPDTEANTTYNGLVCAMGSVYETCLTPVL